MIKRNFEKLNRIVKLGILDLNDFYAVEATRTDIKLQGEMKSDTIAKLRKSRLKLEVDERGYLIYQKNKVRIALT